MVGNIKIQTTDKKYNCFKCSIHHGVVEFNFRRVNLKNVVKIWDTVTGKVLYEHATREIKPRQRTKVFHVSAFKETTRCGDCSTLLYAHEPFIKLQQKKRSVIQL